MTFGVKNDYRHFSVRPAGWLFRTVCQFLSRKKRCQFPDTALEQAPTRDKPYGDITAFDDIMKNAVGEGALPGFPSTVGKSSVGSNSHIVLPN